MTYAPLTLATLSALIPKDLDCHVEVYDEIVGDFPLKKKKYDLVAISCLTSNAPRAYALAERFKEGGAYVVMGGYHPTYMPKEALQHADTVIVGAAEYSFPEFLRDFAAGTPMQIYDKQCVKGEDLCIPDRRVIPRRKYLKYPTLIANRGCPNHCSFCVISNMWSDCTPRPVDRVIEEIKGLKSKMIVFFDPNFFGARAYSIALMRELAKLKIRWAGSATITAAFDTELMELARQSGCAGLLVGLESLSKETLKGAGKGFNRPEEYKRAIAIMQSYGISVNGCFVLGMDGDTEEQLLSLPEQINYLNLNLARFSILTPVPNSPLFHRLEKEGRILTRDWSKYNQHETVFMPTNMSPERLDELYRTVWKKTYSFKNILTRVQNIPNKSLKEKLICLGANLGFKYLGVE
ncbi:MAG: B12-binding domain-containing radical SAM protein [Clostridia bacterium]|nr:B12-binding domain-containing radical SAM protein [Clostridia bacterium]MBQ8398711.1 B12-binding domain-containing radical SAM protein [Clostridia bacterium]